MNFKLNFNKQGKTVQESLGITPKRWKQLGDLITTEEPTDQQWSTPQEKLAFMLEQVCKYTETFEEFLLCGRLIVNSLSSDASNIGNHILGALLGGIIKKSAAEQKEGDSIDDLIRKSFEINGKPGEKKGED